MTLILGLSMSTTIWISTNGKYELKKKSDTYFLFYVDGSEIEIWTEDGSFISNTLCFYDIPKYVKKALDKYVGDIIS